MDLLNASFRIGRLFGVNIHVHILFVIWVAFRLATSQDWQFSAMFTTLLFGIVLAHEFGHCFGARYVGGDAENILMWPLGGLAYANAPMTPWAQFVTVAAGPMVNVVFCIISGAVIAVSLGTIQPLLVNPWFSPFLWLPGWLWYVGVFYSVNLFLLGFNLLPIYPMDGGQLFQCLLWPFLGLRTAMDIACKVGLAGAIAFGLWSLRDGGGGMLTFIAIFGGYTCYQRLQALKYGMVVDERVYLRSQPRVRGGWSRFFGGKPKPRRPIEVDEPNWEAEPDRTEDEVDRILKKVHDQGLRSLTYVERQTLERATRARQNRDD